MRPLTLNLSQYSLQSSAPLLPEEPALQVQKPPVQSTFVPVHFFVASQAAFTFPWGMAADRQK